MSRVVAWLTDVLSELLERDEQQVVLGDLAESGAGGGQALRGVLGLVVRRQLAVWTGWRPWLALVTIVLPIGILLSRLSRLWGQGAGIYLWAYVHNGLLTKLDGTIWSIGGWSIGGARMEFLAWFAMNAVALVIWSFASGWVLGAVARRAIWTIGPLFYFALIFGTLGSDSIGRIPRADVFSPFGYGVIVPVILSAALVIAPALWGMYLGGRSVAPSPSFAVILAVCFVALAPRVALGLNVSIASGSGFLTQDAWLPLLLLVAVSWPIGYMTVVAYSRRVHGGPATR